MIFYSERLMNLVKEKIRGIFARSNKGGETILTKACKRFRFKFIKFLVWLGVDVNTKNKRGETPLWATLNSRNKHRNNVLVRFFIKQKVNLNIGYGGDTPLTFAIKKNDVNLIKLLLENKENKVDINLKNAFGEIPLIIACENDKLDLVKLLIENGANVNCTNKNGESPLWLALKYNKNNLAKLLINNFSNVNFKYGRDTIIEFACKKGNYDLAKLLFGSNLVIDKSNNPLWIILNSKNMGIICKNELANLSIQYDLDINKEYWGDTPLTFAVKENNMYLVSSLISNQKNKVDINKKNSYNESPLWIAINNNYKEITKYLIDNGADVDCTNLSNDTPLIYAIKQNDMELLNMLIKKADVNKGNNKSPLWWAISQNKKDIVKILIENNADIDKEYGSETPLMMASRNGDMELVRFFLENQSNKADINHTNIFEETALWKALNAKKYDILKFLIQHNANLNKQDISGNTPLFVVSKDGNMELVELFLKNNVDLNIENENQETPVLIACIKGYIDIAILLINNNADLNRKDVWKRSVLSIACETNNEKLLKILVHKENEMGKTPLVVACEKGDCKLVKLFIDNGADVNVNIGGRTPLLITLNHIKQNRYNVNSFLFKYYRKIAKYIIDNGANLNEICGNSTPLIYIIPYDTEISKYLIDNGADINMVVCNKTPLLEAIIHNVEVAKYLIDSGANVNVENLKGETPLGVLINKYVEKSFLADSKKDVELAKLLIANGANIDVLYNNLEQKKRRKFIQLLLEDDVVKAIVAIRNKSIKDKETINLLDKEQLGVVKKSNIEMANVFLGKKD